MNKSESSTEFSTILYKLKKEGINPQLYNRISESFNSFVHLSPVCVLEMLSYFVAFKGKPLYVNEIRNYLKNHSKELFITYGSAFNGLPGCFEVFGIPQKAVKMPTFKEDVKIAERSQKEYTDHPVKRRKGRLVKREARKIAADKSKTNLIRRKEKNDKNEEINRLIRKQDL